MDLSNLKGSDAALVLIILSVVIVVIVLIVLAFKEKKRIAEATTKNMDCVIHPTLTFTGIVEATAPDQTFNTSFGQVLVSCSNNKLQADTTSVVLVKISNGPRTFNGIGGALTLVITNRTKNPLIVDGGRIVVSLDKERCDPIPQKVFVGGIAPVSVPANESRDAHLVVVGQESSITDLCETIFAICLRNAAPPPEPAMPKKM